MKGALGGATALLRSCGRSQLPRCGVPCGPHGRVVGGWAEEGIDWGEMRKEIGRDGCFDLHGGLAVRVPALGPGHVPVHDARPVISDRKLLSPWPEYVDEGQRHEAAFTSCPARTSTCWLSPRTTTRCVPGGIHTRTS